jgi:hypothetical protein
VKDLMLELAPEISQDPPHAAVIDALGRVSQARLADLRAAAHGFDADAYGIFE